MKAPARKPKPLTSRGTDTHLEASVDGDGYPWVTGNIVDMGSEIECSLDADHADEIAAWFSKYADWVRGSAARQAKAVSA